LDHPGIPKYEVALDSGDSRFILYHFIDGVSLTQYFECFGKLDEAQSVGAAIDLYGALSYLHARLNQSSIATSSPPMLSSIPATTAWRL
jgi:serine/threonine protein kinase